MSIFGKLLGEVIEGVADTVDISVGLTSDAIKSPVRTLDYICDEDVDFLEDVREAIERAKE